MKRQRVVSAVFASASLAAALVGGMTLVACSGRTESSDGQTQVELPQMTQEEEKAALRKENPVGSYGKGLQEGAEVSLATLAAEGPKYLGEIVRVEGTVDEVCPMRGCWMDMADEDGNKVKIKVVDGQIVFPLSAKGHPVVAEGKLTKFELVGEDAIGYLAHRAEEMGEEFDPGSVGEEPLVVWQIEGTGAVISE